MKKKPNQRFVVAGVAGITGILILAMSWPGFMAVAEDHPAVTQFMLGLMLLFMAAGNLSIGLHTRSWMKQMEKQFKSQQSPAGDTVSRAPEE